MWTVFVAAVFWTHLGQVSHGEFEGDVVLEVTRESHGLGGVFERDGK